MNKIAELRKERNLSQKELGTILGVAQNTVCNWENEKREPDYASLKKMAFYFNCSIDYILGTVPFGHTFTFDEVDHGLDWSGRPLPDDKKPTPVSEDGLSEIDRQIMSYVKSMSIEQKDALVALLRTTVSRNLDTPVSVQVSESGGAP